MNLVNKATALLFFSLYFATFSPVLPRQEYIFPESALPTILISGRSRYIECLATSGIRYNITGAINLECLNYITETSDDYIGEWISDKIIKVFCGPDEMFTINFKSDTVYRVLDGSSEKLCNVIVYAD